jgi:hypothetical protein
MKVYDRFFYEPIGDAEDVHEAATLFADANACETDDVHCVIEHDYREMGDTVFICHKMDSRQIHIGDELFWQDPDRKYSSGLRTVIEINGDIVTLDGGTEAFKHELLDTRPEGQMDVVFVDDAGEEYAGQAISEDEAMLVCGAAFADDPDMFVCEISSRENGSKYWHCRKPEDIEATMTIKITASWKLNGVTLSDLQRMLDRKAISVSSDLLPDDTAAEMLNHRIEVFQQ